MMIYKAERVLPINAPAIENGYVVVDERGMINYVGDDSSLFSGSDVLELEGWIIPGFVNAHCHLELSHMKGVVPTGLGLIPFITDVVQKREAAMERIHAAIAEAEAEMIKNGIVAVGDISNTTDTLTQKQKNNIHYTTFVELFDFLQDKDARRVFDQGLEVYNSFEIPERQAKSLVPHAPYSVSPTLFNLINETNVNKENEVISIHNQETHAENELFRFGTGGFTEFYKKFGISLENFRALGEPAVQYLVQQSDPNIRTLLVHNSLSTSTDIKNAKAWNPLVYWVTCPNANLYIENRLPDYAAFLEQEAIICIGTDSLTSNWQLSVLEEIKTIQRYNSYLDTDLLLRWSTWNGARALNLHDQYGSLEVGKTPGLNLLSFENSKGQSLEKAHVKKLF